MYRSPSGHALAQLPHCSGQGHSDCGRPAGPPNQHAQLPQHGFAASGIGQHGTGPHVPRLLGAVATADLSHTFGMCPIVLRWTKMASRWRRCVPPHTRNVQAVPAGGAILTAGSRDTIACRTATMLVCCLRQPLAQSESDGGVLVAHSKRVAPKCPRAAARRS